VPPGADFCCGGPRLAPFGRRGRWRLLGCLSLRLERRDHHLAHQQVEDLLLVLQRKQADQALEVLQAAPDEVGVQDPLAPLLDVELQLLAPSLELFLLAHQPRMAGWFPKSASTWRISASNSRAGSIRTRHVEWADPALNSVTSVPVRLTESYLTLWFSDGAERRPLHAVVRHQASIRAHHGTLSVL